MSDTLTKMLDAATRSRRRPTRINKAARIAKLNGRAHSPATGYRSPLTTAPTRTRTAPAAPVAPATVERRSIFIIQGEAPQPPVINVTMPAQKATRTRVVETDEEGLATVTVTEPID